MFLHVVGHNQRFRVVHQAFRRSIQTVHKHFHQVLYAVGELRKELIKAPSPTTHPKITGSYRWNPYLKDCIGAIDGTHVLARVPRHMQQAFRGRKTNPTQNVMVAVDFDLKFTYVLAGWEGSAHDALILADAIERDDGFTVPQGKFYLVDAGYACRTGFLPPFRGVRYHLSEFGSRNRPTNARELFNLRHSSLRVTVERAIGALKNRFRILDNKPFHKYKTQVKLVLACSILHNWILGFGIDEIVPDEEGFTGTQQDPLDDNGSQSQESSAMAAKRDAICNVMWEGRGSSRI
ncbi:protein ALP1-like [Zea mays]|nr:protein ALP1-like [Zea mays]